MNYKQPLPHQIRNSRSMPLVEIMKRVPGEAIKGSGGSVTFEVPGQEILGPRRGATVSFFPYSGDYGVADAGGAMIYRGNSEGAIKKLQSELRHLLKMPDLECHYCDVGTEVISGAMLYNNRPDLQSKLFYRCPKCLAYVGTHAKSRQPLGTVARAELRQLRKRCHEVFDRIWRETNLSRSDAYAWLAESLGIPQAACHIAMFDEEQCRLAIDLSRRFAA